MVSGRLPTSTTRDGNLIVADRRQQSTTNYTFNVLNQLTAVNGPGLTASYRVRSARQPSSSQTINGVTTNFQIDPTGLGNVVATLCCRRPDSTLHVRPWPRQSDGRR